MALGSTELLTEMSRLRLKCDGTRAESRFRLSAKGTSPFKSAGASVQSTTGSRGVRISGSNAGYTMFRDSVKSTGYPIHSLFSPSLTPSRASPCALTFQLDYMRILSLGGKGSRWVGMTNLSPLMRRYGSLNFLETRGPV